MPAGENTQPAMAYPTKKQYARWKGRAAELDMSISEFIQAMVEAGIKVDRGFELSLEHDETRQDLRVRRNEIKEELEASRERISELEERLYHGEQSVIREFVKNNPGANYGEIVQHVIDTVPERVIQHLEDLEGEGIFVGDDDRFYPMRRTYDGESRIID